MRYVKKKTVVSKVVDENIDDIDTIKSVLSALRDNCIECCLGLSDGPVLKNARIENVDDDSFSFVAMMNSANIRRSVVYENLHYLEVNLHDSTIAKLKPNVSRWILMDPTDQ